MPTFIYGTIPKPPNPLSPIPEGAWGKQISSISVPFGRAVWLKTPNPLKGAKIWWCKINASGRASRLCAICPNLSRASRYAVNACSPLTNCVIWQGGQLSPSKSWSAVQTAKIHRKKGMIPIPLIIIWFFYKLYRFIFSVFNNVCNITVQYVTQLI